MVIKEAIKRHLIDSTAMYASLTPPLAAFETGLVGMSNEVSLKARLFGAALTYAGMGSIFSKGRDISKRIFGITKEKTEKIKQIHDMAYAATYCLVVAPAIYYVCGERDLKKMAIGTGIQIAFGAVYGGVIGFAVDAFRDFAGIESSERLPQLLEGQSPLVKKSLMGIAVAGSVAATGLVYYLNTALRS